MTVFTWILLLLLAHQTYSRYPSKRKPHHPNVKKSFLADAMKEMEYSEKYKPVKTNGSVQNSTKAVVLKETNHHRNKQNATQKHANKDTVKQDHFVTKTFPSRLITDVFQKQQDNNGNTSKEHSVETPKLGTIHPKLLSKGERANQDNINKDTTVQQGADHFSQNTSTAIITPSSFLKYMVSSSIANDSTVDSSKNSNSVSGENAIGLSIKNGKNGRKNIKDAIYLLQAFVDRLIKENETNETNREQNQSTSPKPITLKQSEKKDDVSKQALDIHVEPEDGQQSTVISGIKYNLAPVYRIKPKYVKDSTANNVNSIASNTSNSSPEQQQQQQQQTSNSNSKQQQQTISPNPEQQQQLTSNSNSKQQQPTSNSRSSSEQQQQQTSNSSSKQQQQRRNPSPEQQQHNNGTKMKLQEDIDRLKQEENTLRQSLVEKELEIQRLKQQTSPSDHDSSNQMAKTNNQIRNTTSENVEPNISPSNNENKENKFFSLKGVPPELLMKLKTILEESKKKGEKFVSKQEVASRKAFETARKLVKAAFAREQLYKAEQDFLEKVHEMMNKTSTANLLKNNSDVHKDANGNDDEGSTIKDYIQQIEDQNQMGSEVRRTNPLPPQANETSNTLSPGVNNSRNATTGSISSKGNNSSPIRAPLDLQSSKAKILKELNRTKGPEEKNVEAAAHLEEKVAEQQDEMYEKLIRQTLGKGMGGDDEDDEEEEEEEGVERNFESRPAEEMPRQENYGDFQDNDENSQSRSEIKDPMKESIENETLPEIDEDSILSLRDKISRPSK